MSDKTMDIVVAGYQDLDAARHDFDDDRAYEDKAPYAFTGTVKKVVFDLKPAAHEDEKALHEHAAMQSIGHGAAG